MDEERTEVSTVPIVVKKYWWSPFEQMPILSSLSATHQREGTRGQLQRAQVTPCAKSEKAACATGS